MRVLHALGKERNQFYRLVVLACALPRYLYVMVQVGSLLLAGLECAAILGAFDDLLGLDREKIFQMLGASDVRVLQQCVEQREVELRSILLSVAVQPVPADIVFDLGEKLSLSSIPPKAKIWWKCQGDVLLVCTSWLRSHLFEELT